MHKSIKSTPIINKKQIHFITLLALIVFCLYIFINLVFPYANIISICFLATGVGIALYCMFDNNELLLTISLVSVLLSILFALFQHPIFT